MLTYEEAKKVALEKTFHPINRAQESDTAYIFDNSEQVFIGGLPMVIRKEDGQIFNHRVYTMGMTQEDYDSIHDIPF